MMRYILNKILIVFFLGLSLSLAGQENITWTTLADVQFEQEYSPDSGLSHDKANFGDIVKSFEGEEVIIQGYVIPLDAMGISYALSRNPNSSCFFCGGAGPETVISLQLKPDALRRYKMDAYKSFKGALQLNETNASQFTYVLLNAEPI
jgi:hypothetical protein